MNKQKRHILLVDDDHDCLFQLNFMLSNEGFEVTAIDTQKQAEKWMEENRPDMAVFDLMMEREDSGFILCRQFKKRYPDVPVMILTAVTPETGISFDLQSPENQQWIMADAYVEKGVNRQFIISRILQLIR